MSLERLLGNEKLKKNLTSALRQNRLSHSYLITGAEGSGKHTLALLLAAAMQCTADVSRPCGVCRQCRKVFSGTHPDVITVDDTEHKTVSVKVVRSAREDLYIRPNEGARKIYIFPRAKDLGLSGENALLKVMEEPPSYGAYLLLADSAQQMLPTIRSRCINLQLSPLDEPTCTAALKDKFPDKSNDTIRAAYLRSGGYLGQAVAFIESDGALLPQSILFTQTFSKQNALELTQLLVPMEKLKRDQFAVVITQWLELLQAALAAQNGIPVTTEEAVILGRSRTAQALMEAAFHLNRALNLARGNISVGTICGALQVLLRS